MIKQSLTIKGSNALVVEGGAIRSIFSAGILDGFSAKNYNPFDLYIGVSAGASNLAFFLSGLQGRPYHAYLNAVKNPHFINISGFILGGDLLDMDWLVNSQFSLELQHVLNEISGKNFLVGMTDIASGKILFHHGMNAELLTALKASMSLPLLCREFPRYRGSLMTDGGIANRIPVDEAIRLGAKKIMVIRARHKDYVKTDSLFHKYIRFNLKHYPELHQLILQRMTIHAKTRKLIASPPPGISIIDITPPVEFRLSRFSKNTRQIKHGYRLGMKIASQALQQWIEIDSAH